ncbi:MAG TPA: hypothetical protein VGJ13_17655 [Pseudonocardiaceae bacterium]|jgi:hypothetical protein
MGTPQPRTDQTPAASSDAYWVDGNAAEPVLLVDQAADAISEALHHVRSGSTLDDRDLAAAGIALRDLLGGLGQLADLLATSVYKYTAADPLEVGRIEDRLETLRAATRHAQHAAEGLQQCGAALGPAVDDRA